MNRRVIVLCASTALIGLSAQAQPPIQMRPQTAVRPAIALSPTASSGAAANLQALRTRGAARIDVARLNPQAIRSATPGQVVTLQLRPDVAIQARTAAVDRLEGGLIAYRGQVDSASAALPPGLATLIVNGDRITGSVRGPNGELYQVRPLADGSNAVVQVDFGALPADEPADQANAAAASGGLASAATGRVLLASFTGDAGGEGQPGVRPDLRNLANVQMLRRAVNWRDILQINPEVFWPHITVQVFYTASAQAAAGDMDALSALAITESNDAFRASGVHALFQRVGPVQLLSYNESGKSFEQMDLDFMGNATAQAARNASHADVTVLIVNNDAYCGRANSIGGGEATASVVVHFSCATGYYSFAHEIGHLAGARHNPQMDDTATPYAFGHGLIYTAGSPHWRTIMAYNDGCGCPRLQLWSTPSVSHNGQAIGTAAGNDNARVWNTRASVMAAWR